MDMLDAQEPEGQAEVFSQSVTPEKPAAPEPEVPAPEPQNTEAPKKPAASEPEAPEVEPAWLYGAPEPPRQQPPPQYYEPPPDYYRHQQHYQQAPPQPRGGGDPLQSFVDNPDAYISQVLEQRLQQYQTPLLQQQQMIAANLQRMQQTYTNSAIKQAESAIKNAYKEFNKDSTFRSSRGLQARVENTLKSIMAQAVQAAQMGDYGPLTNLSGMNASHVRATLAAAKALDGVGIPGVGPLQMEGAEVESARPRPDVNAPSLTPEQEEIARRLGPGYADRLRKAVSETKKYDDFSG